MPKKEKKTQFTKDKSTIDIRSEMMFQTAMDGCCSVSLDGRLLEVNSALCDITGYSKKELLGMKITDIEANETVEQTAQHTDKVIKMGYDRFETKHRRKDGRIIDIEVSSQFCDFEQNKFFFSFFRDITEKKQLSSQLERYKDKVLTAQKHAYISSMGAIVAHQLNQPLTVINMLLGRALQRIEDEPCCPSVIKIIKESLAETQKAALIIRKFRQYSKAPAMETAGTVNISSTANRIISVLSERAKQAKMNISVKDLDALPEVETNETILEQIFLIIIQNAIEAADGKKQHRLNIAGKFEDSKIELQLSDDCCGIAPENLDKIFEPFFSTKSDGRGLGLGLDIVQQILKSCGGEIKVESRLGKGAAFYVTLPISNTLKS